MIIFFAVGGVHPLPLVALLFAIVLLGYGGGFGTMPSREEGSRWRHLLPPRRAHA